jgi:hypothetical protein
MIIAIDAGHGYNTSGKRTCPFEDGRQMREHEFNRDTAYLLDYRLRQAGHQTILCFDDIGIADSTLNQHRCYKYLCNSICTLEHRRIPIRPHKGDRSTVQWPYY